MVALGKQAMEPGEAVGCVTLPPDEMATRAAEMDPKSWAGVLLTSGVVAGPATYDFRLVPAR